MAEAAFAGLLQRRLAELTERLNRWREGGEFGDEVCLVYPSRRVLQPQALYDGFVKEGQTCIGICGQDYYIQKTEYAFLIQASTTLENLAELSEESRDNNTYCRLIQHYTQALLDITYFEENQLVDEEFPEESSLQKVEELIVALSEPENLVNESGIFQEPLEILGIELLECLYWRRGALIYMFCHTVKGRKEWLRKETDLLKKFLKEGIHYLLKMLDFRCTDNPNEEFVVQDTSTAILVNEGIFSDTHLLAMMYCGEMCYWGLKYCGDQGTELHRELPGSSENIIMDFQEIGEKMLTKYIAVCEGPLRSHGWDTKNAKRILDYFKQLSS